MKEFTIGKNDAGQRLDRWLGKAVPLLPAPLAQKYIRLKRVKLNGKGAKRDTRLNPGDLLALYINDEFFDAPAPENAFLSVFQPQLDIVYEDENLLLVNKRPGLVVHPDEHEYVNTLITHIQAYLYQKNEWNPKQENAFTPALCNRIDRNTGGIVIAAKTAEALRIMNQKVKDREIEKYYLCAIHGKMAPLSGKLEGYIVKDEARNQVTVHSHPVTGGRTAVTLYRTLQMNRDNRRYDRKFQALWSYRLVFSFTTDAGILEPLNGRSWQVDHVDFVDEYFGKALPGASFNGKTRTLPNK